MAIRIASAPVCWGIMENVEFPAEYPYSRVLDELVRAGYEGTELGPFGFLPTAPAALQYEINQRGLALCSAFVEMELGNRATHQTGFAHVTQSAKLISEVGARLLILSDAITPVRNTSAGRPQEANLLSWSDSQWRTAVEAIRQVVALCRSVGLKVAFHHHVGTHVETPEEVDRLFSSFSCDELGLCLDTGHYAYGGGDVTSFLEREISRVRCVHLKDVGGGKLQEVRHQRLDFHAAVRHGVFAPLGKGMVDFPRILALLRKNNFDGWVVVEADVLAGGVGADSPLANAVAAREFLRKLGF